MPRPYRPAKGNRANQYRGALQRLLDANVAVRIAAFNGPVPSREMEDAERLQREAEEAAATMLEKTP